MKKSDFSLFFSSPLDPPDWHNLDTSGVGRVMLPLNLATAATLDGLKARGVRVVLRTDEDYYSDDAPSRIRGLLRRAQQRAEVEAVIVGVEPENAQTLTYGAGTWGQQWAYVHRKRSDAVRAALQGLGVKVISAGWTMRSISEDEAPQPGKVTWREIVTASEAGVGGRADFGYNDDEYDGAGCHIYQYGWQSFVDVVRLKFALKEAQSLFHKPLWIDELGISSGGQLQRMAAYLDIATMLLTHPLGERVEMLCPFISNGNGIGWDPGFLMTDPACYRLVREWLAREE